MLGTLLESNAPRQRRRGSTLTSIVIHTLVIGGAIVATAAARTGVRPTHIGPRDTVIYVAPRQQPRPRASSVAPQATSHRAAPPLPSPPILRLGPTSIPSVGVDIAIDRLIGDDPPPSASGLVGRVGRDTTRWLEAEPATVATVDRPAAMRAAPRPRYPEQLRAASVTGRVVVRLIVDTLGRVESSSVVIRESSHDLFERAVRAVLPSLRFTPAEAGGRRVRMLVELPFEFRLND